MSSHYNFFRDYDPATGRYLEADPIGQAGGMNRYAYVGNSPLRFVDVHGLARCTYYIAQHTLVCFANDMSEVLIASEGISSGLNECENEPSCANERDKGPVPPDDYNVARNEKPRREGWWTLQSQDWMPFWSGLEYHLRRRRAGFNLHSGMYSEGCITFLLSSPRATPDFAALTEMLTRDEPNNTLRVIPRIPVASPSIVPE